MNVVIPSQPSMDSIPSQASRPAFGNLPSQASLPSWPSMPSSPQYEVVNKGNTPMAATIPPIPPISAPAPIQQNQTVEAALLDPNQSINTAPEQLNAFNTSWKHRRIMAYVVLLFCAFFIGYIIVKDHHESTIHSNALWALMLMASGIVSTYIGASVVDSKNVLASKLDFAKSQNLK